MRRRDIRRAVLALALTLAPMAARAQTCAPFESIISDVMANTPGARADVTDRFACHFPAGMSFNAAAVLLERNRFDFLNPVEPIFHRWRIGGEEFTSRRVVSGFWSRAEFRVTIHTVDKTISRFSAQYLSGR